jgi:hypothetical protein
MGLTSSTESKQQEREEQRLNNIKKLFNNNDNTDDIIETLNLTEFKPVSMIQNKKKAIPLVGGGVGGGGSVGGGVGGSVDVGYDNDEKHYDNNNNILANNVNNKRYTKYDLFKILKDIDSEFQKGGKEENNSDENSSLNDEKSMDHIKNIILKELENLKKNKSEQLGGAGCVCDGTKQNKFSMKNVEVEQQIQGGGAIVIDNPSSDSSSSSSTSSSEVGKKKGKTVTKKAKKNTKSSKKAKKSLSISNEDDDNDNNGESNSSRFFIETSESGTNEHTSNADFSENGKKKKKTKAKKIIKNKVYDKEEDEDENEENNDDNTKENNSDSEGLSIFPFNSSDVKSSLSVKNYRMLRRKI